MFPVRIILLPTDFSDPATQAHSAACDLAREHKARLVVLHVTAKPVVSYIEKATELPAAEFQQKLWETLQWPRDCEQGLDVVHRVEEGNAIDQIIRVAEEVRPDLIVMGTHGRRGILNWFTTNVTDEIVRSAPCSVLIVKAPQYSPPDAAKST